MERGRTFARRQVLGFDRAHSWAGVHPLFSGRECRLKSTNCRKCALKCTNGAVAGASIMNGSSYYKLTCAGCCHEVQLPARDGDQQCPNCGGPLYIEWHGGHVDLEQVPRDTQETPTAS